MNGRLSKGQGGVRAKAQKRRGIWSGVRENVMLGGHGVADEFRSGPGGIAPDEGNVVFLFAGFEKRMTRVQ